MPVKRHPRKWIRNRYLLPQGPTTKTSQDPLRRGTRPPVATGTDRKLIRGRWLAAAQRLVQRHGGCQPCPPDIGKLVARGVKTALGVRHDQGIRIARQVFAPCG